MGGKLKTIQLMYKHLHWANQRILETLQTIEGELAEKVWLTRLLGLDSSQLPIWMAGDLAICTELVWENEQRFITYLSNLTNAENFNIP